MDEQHDANPRHLVVIGLMGAGKSSVGRTVAQALGRPFVDNDEELVARTGLNAHDHQERHGRSALHRQELEVLRDCLRHPVPSVITAAASVIDTEPGRCLLRARAFVAWVDADPAVLARRVADGDGHRPGHIDKGVLTEQRSARSDHFREVADIVLRTDGSKRAAAAELLRWSVRMELGSDG